MSEPSNIDYSSIKELDLSEQNLRILPDLSLYVNLKKLYCGENYIISLDNLPPNLKILYCSDNNLTNLDNLPSNLEELYCCYDNITSLDNLPKNLKKLECSGNPLNYDFEPTLENIRKYQKILEN